MWDITAQVNRDDREAVGNDGCWRWGVLGKGVERETEDQPGNFRLLRPLVPKLGELYKCLGDESVFITGWFIVIPREVPTVRGSDEYPMDGIHSVGEFVATEISLGWENPGVALADIIKHA